MRNKNFKYLALLAMVSLSPAALAGAQGEHAAEAPAANTQSLAEKVTSCAACHGPDGHSQNPMYPSLAGQYENYIAASLKAYKTGERKNPIMAGMAAPLTDQDIKQLAAYFSKQKGPLYTPAIR